MPLDSVNFFLFLNIINDAREELKQMKYTILTEQDEVQESCLLNWRDLMWIWQNYQDTSLGGYD